MVSYQTHILWVLSVHLGLPPYQLCRSLEEWETCEKFRMSGVLVSNKSSKRALFSYLFNVRASLLAQRLKRLPPMRETRVWSLGREDPLKKEMAIHYSILAWRIPWTEKPSRLQSTGSQRVGHDWTTSPHLTYSTYKSATGTSRITLLLTGYICYLGNLAVMFRLSWYFSW